MTDKILKFAFLWLAVAGAGVAWGAADGGG